jgi:hypothetical protein
MINLAPGTRHSFRVVLNGEGGYKLDRPGRYYLVFLGSGLGLPDSDRISIEITP